MHFYDLFAPTLSGKMLGESDENSEGLTKSLPDVLSPAQDFYPIFYPRAKLLPEILYPNQNSNPNFCNRN